jgi:two-component system NtrC family sensor kinase
VVALLVLFFTHRLVLRPVRALSQATRRLAAGDLEHVIELESDDELGRLAASFNTMTRELQRAQGELQALMQSLERQVDDRTRALRDAQAALVQSEKMSSLGKLAASIAHEINNPLAGILTISKLLLRTLEAGPPGERDVPGFQRQLRLVERETERCTTIVRNLLAFARQRPLSNAEIDACAPLEEALGLAGHQAKMQNVVVERRLPGPLPVEGDFGQLRQACLNLVINAIEAMPAGGTLTASARALEDGGVELEVTDTGQGIPPEILPRVLDPFFTTKEKGTGLGLSVVYGIVRRHGGRLDVASTPGQGTQVRLRLPRRLPAPAPEAEPLGAVLRPGGGAGA